MILYSNQSLIWITLFSSNYINFGFFTFYIALKVFLIFLLLYFYDNYVGTCTHISKNRRNHNQTTFIKNLMWDFKILGNLLLRKHILKVMCRCWCLGNAKFSVFFHISHILAFLKMFYLKNWFERMCPPLLGQKKGKSL